ncbi:facilitated trehalose transporter Tret1-like [Drosophila nasuta]|uniref:facilitated trehalose transporter Tret1-like n=1 Tax=Drosophila nasuta TaxID=42062 RepID=UPI00295E4F70|nr:facilitated trehalose transporter Tret1-like [Drosophila nasuta]
MSTVFDLPGGQNQYVAGFFASLGALSFGASIGWSAPAQYFILKKDACGFSVDLDDYGWICSAVWLGCFIIVIPSGWLASLWGRKTVMLLAVPLYLGSWALIIFALNRYMLMLGRFLQGVAGGCYVLTVPLYCTEIAQLGQKETLGAFFSIFYVLGILYAYVLGAFHSYKYLNYACAILPFLFLITFVWMPESPVYYLMRLKPLKAEKSLRWLRNQNVALELIDLQTQVKKVSMDLAASWQSMRLRSTWRALFICIGLMFFKIFSGGTAIITYSTALYRLSKTDFGFESEMSTVVGGIVLVIFSIVSVSLLKCVGRRTLLMFSAFLVALCNSLIAIYFYLTNRKMYYMDRLNWLPFFALTSLIGFYALGLGTLIYVIVFDLFLVGFQTIGKGIVWTCFAFFAFLNVKSVLIIAIIWGLKETFWTSTVFAILSWIFIYFMLPETKDLTPEEIQEKLQSNKWFLGLPKK